MNLSLILLHLPIFLLGMQSNLYKLETSSTLMSSMKKP